MFPKPKIAILIPRDYWTRPAASLTGNGTGHRALPDILEALDRAGAQTEVLEPQTTRRPDEFQGLLLPGGADIHPRYYRQECGPQIEPTALDVEYDEFELYWAQAALQASMPVLGICRGMQILNVAAGGTLHQHLPEHLPAGVLERPELRRRGVHALHIAPDCPLATLLAGVQEVNSIHHQGLDALGAGWRACAWAHDGVVEAIERPQAPWQRGVQFHPEDLRHLAPFQAIFEQLVEDARRD